MKKISLVDGEHRKHILNQVTIATPAKNDVMGDENTITAVEIFQVV